jgi:hypothetical protein
MTKKIKEIKKPAAKQSLRTVTTTTAKAKLSQEPILAKGNAIETGLDDDASGSGTTMQQPPEPPKPEEPKPPVKRGRPLGSTKKKEPDAEGPKEPQPDIVTPSINGLLIPMIAKKMKREAKDIMFTKEEMEMLSKLQPQNDWSKPSWPVYIITAVSIIVIHVTQAEKISQEIPEIKIVHNSRNEPPKNASTATSAATANESNQ